MQSPEQIEAFVEELSEVWKDVPALRFGQFVECAFRHYALGGPSLYFVNDRDFLRRLRSFAAKVRTDA